MTLRLKHNKKRNTALLYEMLVREVIKQSVDKDTKKRNKAISLLKECFSKGTEIGKELQLFKNLLETKNLLPYTAEKLIQETKKEYATLDIKKVFSEQSILIKKINKELSSSVFSNFVPNYRSIATLSQVFGEDVSIKKRIILEENILKQMTAIKRPLKKENTKLSTLVVNKFISKFNKKYGESLLERQQELLGKYILSFLDNGADFKIYLNEEIGNLKKTIDGAFGLEEVARDVGMSSKMKEVKKLLETTNQKPIDQEMLQQILKIQALVKEIES
jgi:hypothetical protein